MNQKRNKIAPKDSNSTETESQVDCECADSLAYYNQRFARPPALKRRASNVEKALLQSSGERCELWTPTILDSIPDTKKDDEIEQNEGSDIGSCRDPSASPQSSPPQSNTLLTYFASMTNSKRASSSLDLDFLRRLIESGVSVNATDAFGQTVLHEAVRTWGLKVAQFLVDQGADVNIADKHGRTPLHVAAATDHQDMVKLLVDHGADVEARTSGEKQTPLHYAARNEAVQCVKTLLAYDAEIDARDYKQRTPLLVAAEFNSAEAAAMLLENGAFAGVKDDSGLSAMVSLILKMPSVAIRALDQFHLTDRAHRKQQSYLNFLENCDSASKEADSAITKRTRSMSPLQAVVETNCFELVMHPIFQRLIDVKWQYFGRRAAWADILLNLCLTVIFTSLAVTLPDDARYYYTPLRENWWRIPLELVLVFLFLNEVRKEVREYYRSRRKLSKWTNWRTNEISRDFTFCHPRWPQEKLFLEKEITLTKERKAGYFKDFWNIMDWIAYTMLVIVFCLHFIRVFCPSCKQAEVEVITCTLIVIWIRLLKYARPFPAQGPFVVILGRVMTDVFRWLFIAMMFYIPYAAAFWIMFGGRSSDPVHGYEDIPILIFTMIRFPLVDEYNFTELRRRNPLMAQVLCGSFLVLGAIILMNMFIALMSDTFQRVYDNAKATAAMQRARLIQEVESDAPKKKLAKYKEFIKRNCSPEERDYLVVITDEEDQTRKQTEKIAELHNVVSQRLSGKKFGKIEKCDFEVALEDINLLKDSNNELNEALKLLAGRIEEIAAGIHARIDRLEISHSQALADARLSQEKMLEETQLLLVRCSEENRALHCHSKEDLKVFETRKFEELNLAQAEATEEIRISQEENFQELKHIHAMGTEELKLLGAHDVEELKQFYVTRGAQVRKSSRKQSVQEVLHAEESHTLENMKLESAKRFKELEVWRAQRFEDLKAAASRHFKKLRSVKASERDQRLPHESSSKNAESKMLGPPLENDDTVVDHQNEESYSSQNSPTNDNEVKTGESKEEKVCVYLIREIEDLRQVQAEKIANIRCVQDQKIRELKGLSSSDKQNDNPPCDGAVDENNRQEQPEQEEKMVTLRKIYGGSASRERERYSPTKVLHPMEGHQQNEQQP